MGIRFLCHNCEARLNVKSNQAGQAGQCPSCKTAVQIPMQSTILSEAQKAKQRRIPRPKAEATIGLHSVEDQDTIDGDLPGRTDPSNAAVIKPQLQKLQREAARKDNGDCSNTFRLDKPSPPPTFGKIDPIEEAPNKIWYFRSHKLGEKGPLKAKAMRAHFDQGDVTIGCVVWREDWEDWVEAEKVFPSLAAKFKENQQKKKLNRAFKDADYDIPAELNPDSELSRLRRKRNVIFGLCIAIGVLVIIALGYYLLSLVAPPEPPAEV